MDKTIDMARKAGAVDIASHGWTSWVGTQSTEFLKRFEDLVRADEREAQCTVDVSGAAGPSCEPLNWHKTAAQPATEVLRLSKDGIWANPDIPADDAAKLVLEAIDHNIKILVQKAVLAEREACAKVCAEMHLEGDDDCGLAAEAIRARGNT
jgi:hypothetical protein